MLIYDILFILFSLFALPLLCLRGKLHRGYLERMGFIGYLDRFKESIWLHAVSVGEVISLAELVKNLRVEFPHIPLVITTVTSSGNKVARTLAKENDIVTYLPLDISFIIKRFIKKFNPTIFIAMEAEIWPNLIIQLSRQKIPKLILNGRITDRAFKRYLFFRPILKPVLAKFEILAMQNEDYALKIKQLGADPKKIEVTGSMKFDAQGLDDSSFDIEKIKSQLRLRPDEILFLAGCTHKGEEAIILSVFKNLSKGQAGLRLLIAPRHIERVREVEELVSSFGFSPLRISSAQDREVNSNSVYILDTIGRLKDYYALSSLTFVGGSLVPKGGHNILEPAFFSKPIIFGKYMDNFSDIRDLFLKGKAAIEVEGKEELQERLIEVLENSSLAKALGLRAKAVLDDNKGATSRNLYLIKRILKENVR